MMSSVTTAPPTPDETTSQVRETLTETDKMSIKVTVITLAALCVLAADTFSVYPGCCRKYIKGKLRFEIIKGYSVQVFTEMCPINAIIFHTSTGKVCTNPALNWVMDYVNRIRYKAQKIHQKAQALQ